MNPSPILGATFLTLISFGTNAQAEWRCDCTTIQDTCNASVVVENDRVSIESDHLQCARVDYLIDGLPFVALVVDGHERLNWLTRRENPRVLMQSCQVCLDNATDDATPSKPLAVTDAPTVESERSGERELVPLLAVDPQLSVASIGIEGFVEVSFTVTALGSVENAKVTAAEPAGVFDQATLAALSRWRYGADARRAAVTLTHRFDFKPDRALGAPSATSPAPPETAIDALIARSVARVEGGDVQGPASEPVKVVRNHCIREQVSYDFGEIVEADLMNTCSEPLLVYSCAEGMGRYHRRWVCHTTETAQRILVRPGDRLAGDVAMIDIPEGSRTFKYAEDFRVARPPNTEYWWLACGIDDGECRGSGRQWARSMDGKAASVDPQLWTEQSVARSY